jgi:hypothetical protein
MKTVMRSIIRSNVLKWSLCTGKTLTLLPLAQRTVINACKNVGYIHTGHGTKLGTKATDLWHSVHFV